MAAERLLTGRVWLVVAGTTVFSMLTGLVVWVSMDRGCDGELPLSVTTAPEIAPAVQEAAELWRAAGPAVNGTCVRVRVTAADPARVAAAIAQAVDGEIDVADVAPAAADLPQVWIPDSTTWLTRVRAVEREAVGPDAPSVAMSPVVLALPEPAARAEGWPARQIGWDYLLGGMRNDPPLRVGVVDPRRSAAGLSAVLLTGQLAEAAAKIAGTNTETAVFGAFRELSKTRSATTDELLSRMPKGDDAAGRLQAAFLTERVVREYDAGKPAVPLAAVYPEPAAPVLDYPYATLRGLSGAEAEASGLFRRFLRGDAAGTVFTGHGFRRPDGAVGPDFPTGHGVSPEPVTPSDHVPLDVLDRALRAWGEVSMASRVLAVLDVSGSMAEPVPSAGGLSRWEVTRRAAVAGLDLFTDDSDLGLWVFSTELDGERDYQELVPVGPLTENREQIAAALNQVQPKPGGGTALFDTIRAGYRQMVEDYDPEHSNTLVVMTDGRNQDPAGITSEELLADLDRVSDPDRPVHLVVIGIGPDVDQQELQTIVDGTSGAVFLAPDPSKIGEIFLKALALPSGDEAPR